VRGLDYYTRTAFEVHDRSLGAQSTLGGGGRYDGLIEALGGPPTPGVGFSIGLDRAILVIEQRGAPGGHREPEVYIVSLDPTVSGLPMMVRELRREFAVDCDFESRSLNAQMKSADKSGARLAVLVGGVEWTQGEVVLKDLSSGAQETLKREQLADALRARLLSPAREIPTS